MENLIGNKEIKFSKWIKDESINIENALLSKATEFLEEQSNCSVSSLTFNKWIYLNKAGNKGYIASIKYDNGIPLIIATYNDFKETATFNSKHAFRELWHNYKYENKKFYTPKVGVKKAVNVDIKEFKIDLNAEKSLWKSLESIGTSPYLERKNLLSLPDIKYGSNFIAVKIVDIEGKFCGLQKIYNNGFKCFSKGLKKKGHFAVINSKKLHNNVKTINVCEGVSTAGSIDKLTNQAVFAALDAGNLKSVVFNLSKKYKKASFIIWADDDKWGKENTGLIKAHEAASLVNRAIVRVPDFSAIGYLAEEHKLTDFNDLDCFGEICFNDYEPNYNLGLVKKSKDKKNYNYGILSVNNFKYRNAKRIIVNNRFLDCKIEEGINLIRSPIGTGKTELIKNYIKEDVKKVLYLSHLVHLVESSAHRLGLTSYKDCNNIDLQTCEKLAICLNSLPRLSPDGDLPNISYDLLVLDEIEQSINRLGTDIRRKTLIINIILDLISKAKTVVFLDADLGKNTVELVKNESRPVNIVINEYQILNRSIELYKHKNDLQNRALKALDNDKVYLTLNNKQEAHRVFNLFQHQNPHKKGLLISSDTSHRQEVKDFFKDVNSASLLYDYVICSPSAATGISIDNNHFTFVGGIFNNTINTPNDCKQAIGRVRNISNYHVWVDNKKVARPTDRDKIKSEWIKKDDFDAESMKIVNGKRVVISDLYEEIKTNSIQDKHYGFNNFLIEFCTLALLDGFTINHSKHILSQESRKIIKNAKEHLSDKKSKDDVSNAKVIDDYTASILKVSHILTIEEEKSLKRHEIAKFFNLDINDSDLVSKYVLLDKKLKVKNILDKVTLALEDKDYAAKLYKEQFTEDIFRADVKHFSTLQTLLKKTLCVTQVLNRNKLEYRGFKYNKEYLIKSDFMRWIKKNYNALQGVIHMPTLASLEDNPLHFIGRLLNIMGLKHKRVGNTHDGNYMVLEDSINLINALLVKTKRNTDSDQELHIEKYYQKILVKYNLLCTSFNLFNIKKLE